MNYDKMETEDWKQQQKDTINIDEVKFFYLLSIKKYISLVAHYKTNSRNSYKIHLK